MYILINRHLEKRASTRNFKVHNNIKRMLLFEKEQDIKAKLVSVTTVMGAKLFKRIITVSFV